MASYPWTVPHKRQQMNLDDFPHLKRWHEAIAAYRQALALAPSEPEQRFLERRLRELG